MIYLFLGSSPAHLEPKLQLSICLKYQWPSKLCFKKVKAIFVLWTYLLRKKWGSKQIVTTMNTSSNKVCKNTTVEERLKGHTCNQCDYTSTVYLQCIWGGIWKSTLGINHTNAINVTLHLVMHWAWRNIWTFTQEKNHTNAAIVTIHLLH